MTLPAVRGRRRAIVNGMSSEATPGHVLFTQERKVIMSNSARHATNSDTFRTIERRLGNLNPPVLLTDHIGSELRVHGNTLDGVDFVAKDRKKLLTALRAAKDTSGEPVFAEGSKEDPKHWARKGIKGDPKHWALKLSFAATDGIGFREIWRLRLTDRTLRLSNARPPGLNIPPLDGRFSANFGDNINLPDLSSLHCAVAEDTSATPTRTICNIHIDEMGFVMTGPDNEVVVDPDFLRHTLVELLWKTKLKGELPSWAIDRVNLIVPSSPNRYAKVGISFDLAKSKQYKLAISGSCGLAGVGGFECSGTMNLTGTHDLGGSH